MGIAFGVAEDAVIVIAPPYVCPRFALEIVSATALGGNGFADRVIEGFPEFAVNPFINAVVVKVYTKPLDTVNENTCCWLVLNVCEVTNVGPLYTLVVISAFEFFPGLTRAEIVYVPVAALGFPILASSSPGKSAL